MFYNFLIKVTLRHKKFQSNQLNRNFLIILTLRTDHMFYNIL